MTTIIILPAGAAADPEALRQAIADALKPEPGDNPLFNGAPPQTQVDHIAREVEPSGAAAQTQADTPSARGAPAPTNWRGMTVDQLRRAVEKERLIKKLTLGLEDQTTNTVPNSQHTVEAMHEHLRVVSKELGVIKTELERERAYGAACDAMIAAYRRNEDALNNYNSEMAGKRDGQQKRADHLNQMLLDEKKNSDALHLALTAARAAFDESQKEVLATHRRIDEMFDLTKKLEADLSKAQYELASAWLIGTPDERVQALTAQVARLEGTLLGERKKFRDLSEAFDVAQETLNHAPGSVTGPTAIDSILDQALGKDEPEHFVVASQYIAGRLEEGKKLRLAKKDADVRAAKAEEMLGKANDALTAAYARIGELTLASPHTKIVGAQEDAAS